MYAHIAAAASAGGWAYRHISSIIIIIIRIMMYSGMWFLPIGPRPMPFRINSLIKSISYPNGNQRPTSGGDDMTPIQFNLHNIFLSAVQPLSLSLSLTLCTTFPFCHPVALSALHILTHCM